VITEKHEQMKKFLKIYLSTSVILLATLVSCDKFDEVNIDPTKSSDMDPGLQLAWVQVNYSGHLENVERLNTMMTMPMVQHIGGIWANRWGQMYIKSANYMHIIWENSYPNDVLNIVDAVERTTDDETKTNLNAICRIMRVYVFARLTDLYGDIPYTEASQAAFSGLVRPAYDKQEDIYNDFFKELKEAAQQLDAAKDPVPTDLFYSGDIALWKKFANSLRLRCAMRLIKVNPTKAEAEAVSAYEDGVFASNEEMCIMKHENVQSDYADVRGNAASVGINQHEVLPRLSNTLINAMRNTNDPRLAQIARYYIDVPYQPFTRVDITQQVVDVVGYTGVNPTDYVWDDWKPSFDINVPGRGAYTVSNNEQKAQLANFLIQNDAPFFHLTYAEVELLLADASLRFGNKFGDNAQIHYERGVRAALEQLALFRGGPVIPNADITTFVQGVPLIPGRELEIVNTQLWIALFLNGPEAYANWRRTGYPVLPSSVTGESDITTTPRRFEYPLTEREQNSTNYQAAVQRLSGGDAWNSRVWWDAE